MDYDAGPIDPVDPAQSFAARAHAGDYQALVAQAVLDVGGAGAAVDGARTTIAGAAGVDTTLDLAPHEADLASSQADDDAGLPALALVDETKATTAAGPTIDAGIVAAGGASDAHAALSPQIDDGQAEIPTPPSGIGTGDLPPDDAKSWRDQSGSGGDDTSSGPSA